MGSSAVQVVREAIEAFARGDRDAALELCAPDLVVRDPGRTGRTIHGREGLHGFWDEWLENWQEYRAEPVEFVEAGDEILVHSRQTGLGRLSGIEIDQDLFQVFRVRDGRIVEYRIYAERAEALASIGADS